MWVELPGIWQLYAKLQEQEESKKRIESYFRQQSFNSSLVKAPIESEYFIGPLEDTIDF
jgi:hypothetical protein